MFHNGFAKNHTENKENAVDSFIHKHQDKIIGSLFCPDRLIFKGHLPISYAQGMENFLSDRGILLKDFQDFGPQQAQRLKEHAEQLNGGPIQFLRRKARKDELARQIAHAKGIGEGLITVFSCQLPPPLRQRPAPFTA